MHWHDMQRSSNYFSSICDWILNFIIKIYNAGQYSWHKFQCSFYLYRVIYLMLNIFSWGTKFIIVLITLIKQELFQHQIHHFPPPVSQRFLPSSSYFDYLLLSYYVYFLLCIWRYLFLEIESIPFCAHGSLLIELYILYMMVWIKPDQKHARQASYCTLPLIPFLCVCIWK